MENTQVTKIEDLRQSEGWSTYQKSLGWKIVETSKGTKIAYMKVLFNSICKIQRPHPLDKQEILEIEKLCRKLKAFFVRIEPSLDQNLNLLQEEGYYLSPYPLLPPSTLFIDLRKTQDELWKNINKSGRYSIRRAQREGVTVDFYKNPPTEIIETFAEISKHTAKEKNFSYSPLSELITKVNAFKDKSFISIAKDGNGEILGAKFYLGYKKNVWYLHGGTTDIGREGNGGYELMWESILNLKKEGFEILDLEGLDDKRFPNFTKQWGGFSYFKEKFGGRRVEFPYPHVKLISPIFKLLEKFYGNIPL